MRVMDVMSTPARTVTPADTASAAWEQMRLHRIRHLVVVQQSQILGVLSATDLGGPHGDSVRSGRLVADLMSDHVVRATPETTVREVANLMRGHVIDCLPIVKGRTLAGVVTSLDLLDLIGRGADRPVATAERRVLKARGNTPRAQVKARLTGGATRRTRR